MSLRPGLLLVHRWSGLTIGLLLVVVAVTGAAMAYRPFLEPLTNRQLWHTTQCRAITPIDALVKAAANANPTGGVLNVMRLTGPPGSSYQVRFSDDRWVYIDPCKAQVIGIEHRYSNVFGMLDALHRFKYFPNSDLISGTLALLASVLLLVGGIILWWPKSRRGLQHALFFKPALHGRALWLSLHRCVAIYASVLLLTLALTGATQAFTWAQSAVLLLTGSATLGKADTSHHVAGAVRLPIEQLWQHAQALVPTPRATLIRFPKKPDDGVDFELIAADAPHGMARTYLTFDAYTGKVLRFIPYVQASRGHQAYLWLVALHTGMLEGGVVRLLMVLAALSVPVLAVTGIRSYFLGRRRARLSPLFTIP